MWVKPIEVMSYVTVYYNTVLSVRQHLQSHAFLILKYEKVLLLFVREVMAYSTGISFSLGSYISICTLFYCLAVF